ncbi:LpxI family protein [Candidatus Tisiphia endosymbiont of Nemotelus uliginosus]|uniref:LpxI family protein n=1 Tax=Candidatus Tisiphia endosymbiont of Nemotelus uliginosus TaxID=3077926 RepID=UPI0035C8ED77
MVSQTIKSSSIGIIAGDGDLPVLLANNFRQQGKQCYIAILSAEVDGTLYKNCSYQFFKIGMVGAIIEYLNQHNVKDIVLAGKVKRVNLRSIKVDLIGSLLLARILKQTFLGDNKLLSIIIAFLQEKGFNIVSYYEMLNESNEMITQQLPSAQDLLDITLGKKLLDSISTLDVGQAVVVEDGYIIGIEAAEGTDHLITRCADLRKNSTGAILIKGMKKGQDTRVDMPTIGLQTIHNLINHQYKGIAVEKNKVVIIEPELMVELANKYGLFIHNM